MGLCKEAKHSVGVSFQSSFAHIRNFIFLFIYSFLLSRGSRTPYWGLEQSPNWMPASSRKEKISGGEGLVGPWHREGHRVRSANQTSRPETMHVLVAVVL